MSTLTNIRIKTRTDTLENWLNVNPVLEYGELAVVIDGDNVSMKAGNGTSRFDELDFINGQKFKTNSLEISSNLSVSNEFQFDGDKFGITVPNGLDGIYVGEQTLSSIIDDKMKQFADSGVVFMSQTEEEGVWEFSPALPNASITPVYFGGEE